MPEPNDPQRMQRCAAIASRIVEHAKATGTFQYILRATSPVAGLELAELRKQTFLVGVGNEGAEVPLDDVLVIFSLVESQVVIQQQLKVQTPGNYTAQVQIPPTFSDAEALRLLTQLRIETPFDQGEVLQFVAGKRPG